MKYLLDASALVELFLSLRAESLIEILHKCCILDLTVYEFCNALWKLAKIRKQISEETALIGAKLLEKMISGNKIRVIGQWTDLKDRMHMSLRHYINAYDIAYVHMAKSKNLILVTDDPRMHTNAKNVFKLDVLRVNEFLSMIFTA